MKPTPIPGSFRRLQKALSSGSGVKQYEDHLIWRMDGFRCSRKEKLASIKSFIKAFERTRLGSCILAGQILKKIDLPKVSVQDIKDDTLSLVIEKASRNGFYYFFTLDGLKNALDQNGFVQAAKNVWVAEKFQPFSSITTHYQQWDSKAAAEFFTWQGMSDPRKLVRDLTIGGDEHVPQDIRPWLLIPNLEPAKSKTLDVWKAKAAGKLSMTLPSEIRSSEDKRSVSFKGEKLRSAETAELSDPERVRLFPILFEAAGWAYSNLQDAEIKHTLLNYQLASEWALESTYPEKATIERALASAREAYKLHLQGSNRELLKAYEDIKKSLQDEVNRFAENTRGLISNFWRDFAIAAGVLVLKFVTSNSNLSPTGIRILYTATSAFLLVSLLITITTNARFNKITQNNRAMWRQKLYPFVDDKKYDEMVDQPISKGYAAYKLTVYITVFIYVVIASYLLYVAFVSI